MIKKGFIRTILGLFVILSVLSCDKDEAEPGEIKFKADGVEYTYSGEAYRGEIYSSDGTQGLYSVNISYGAYYNDFYIGLSIWQFEDAISEYSINTYNRSFNPNVTIDGEYYRGEDTGIGSITITDLTDNRIKGEFNFKAKSESNKVVTVTEGYFDVPYNPIVDED